MAKAMEWWHDELPDDAIRNAGLDPHDRTVQCVLRLVQQLTRFPRHLSQTRRRLRNHRIPTLRNSPTTKRRHAGPNLYRVGQGRY